MFKSERMELERTIQADERRQEIRKKLLKFIEENLEMGEYIKYVTNSNMVIGVVLGILLSCIGIELILIGFLFG